MKCGWCESRHIQLTQRKMTGGSIQLYNQCLTCGQTVGSAVGKSNVPDYKFLPLYDERIKKTYVEQKRQKREQEKREFFDEYDKYLKSPEWRSKRAKVLDRADYICEGCRDATATCVHHLTYSHVYRELLFQLVALCDDCHRIAHETDS